MRGKVAGSRFSRHPRRRRPRYLAVTTGTPLISVRPSRNLGSFGSTLGSKLLFPRQLSEKLSQPSSPYVRFKSLSQLFRAGNLSETLVTVELHGVRYQGDHTHWVPSTFSADQGWCYQNPLPDQLRLIRFKHSPTPRSRTIGELRMNNRFRPAAIVTVAPHETRIDTVQRPTNPGHQGPSGNHREKPPGFSLNAGE